MTRDRPLAGQAALVTGAATGIGRAIARALAAAGANVAINYLSRSGQAEDFARDLTASQGVEAVALQADVSVEAEVQDLFRAAVGRFGTLDIVVCNAGIQQDASFVDMTLEQWRQVLAVNLTGAFLCAREGTREFLRRGPDSSRSKATGKILFTSSVHQVIPWAGHANYAASKGGIMLLMKSLAQELAPQGIRVNAIAPGAIKTDINKDAWENEEAREDLRRLIPCGRIGEPDDIGPAAAWLASDQADYVTGTTLYVDGGMLLYPGFRTGG